MRLFIAIDFDALKDYFANLQELLPRNSKLSFAKSFHITLKFLGEVQPQNLEEITNALKNIRFESFAVFLDSIGIFPTENYIRVVWVGLNPEDRVLELQKTVDEALKSLFKKEKDFKAHITLARVKYLEDKNQFLQQLKRIKVENKKIEIKNFKLVKSTLMPNGPVYEDVAIFTL